jgi:glutamate--cysteine ligase
VGLEKEGLRVGPDGKIAQTPHPEAYGSPLTNPYITTDYSEALLELITPPCNSSQEAVEFMTELHQFVCSELQDELIWNASMPCVVSGESSIPLARYGSSNAAQMKTVYRRGLGHRYGRIMQVIAGIHFNYSFSTEFWQLFQELEGDAQPPQEFISERYFGLLRNLQRIGWIVPYLFGASPAICSTFLDGKPSNLDQFDQHTFFGPWATSLRMGDIGYQNNKENEIGVKACYDNLDEYINTLGYAVRTSYPGYEKIGVKVDGVYQQLNSSILQIENEYYSTVRPKQIPLSGEAPIIALKNRGVAYVELRSIDINPFMPIGVELEQLRFLELLMAYGLLSESPSMSPWERVEIDKNEMAVAHQGRKPGLKLQRHGSELALRCWGEEIIEQMLQIAELFDQDEEGRPYLHAVEQQRALLSDPEKTPSARVLREMSQQGEAYFTFARRHSQGFQQQMCQVEAPPKRLQLFRDAVAESNHRREVIEQGDSLTFEEYLAHYFSQLDDIEVI